MMGYIVPLLIASVISNVLLAKGLIKCSNDKKDLEKRITEYKKAYATEHNTEVIKSDIRNKYNEKDRNITNGTESVLVPNIPKHNHSFGSACGKDCPAYSE